MKTSELSLLFDSSFNKKYINYDAVFTFHSDENTTDPGKLKDEDGHYKQYKDDISNDKKINYGYTYQYLISSKLENGTTSDKNYIKNTVSGTYARDINNPYLNLLKHFNEANNAETSLELDDFIYLRDIGVYPVNRLVILRRFNSPPSHDLIQLSQNNKIVLGKPISKVIGWVKEDDDIFDMSFNEVWKNQSEHLHQIITGMINDQFKINIAQLFPMPGWGQSVMFSFLNKLGWTKYDGSNLPIGDPNLLRTGITRETESTGLASSMNFTLETTYELKYVHGVDPTLVFQKIIRNLLNMGTQNMSFLFVGGKNIQNLIDFAENPNVKDLYSMISNMINKIIITIKEEIRKIRSKPEIISEVEKAKKAGENEKNRINSEKLTENQANAKKEGNWYIYTDLNGKEQKLTENEKAIADKNHKINIENKTQKTNEENSNNAANAAQKKTLSEKLGNVLDTLDKSESVLNFITGIMDSVLKSTIARYEYPLKGAVAQETGMNMTPWHLTIGNPKAPIISMNHIKVDDVNIKLSGEMFYNDLPRYITATIKISNNRPFGKQEIYKFFNNTFIREYTSSVKFIPLTKEYIEKELEKTENKKENKTENNNPLINTLNTLNNNKIIK